MSVKAPWTEEQVEALKRYQADGRFHPFTCPGEGLGCGDHRELIPTTGGWVCACGRYRQDWAHGFMFALPPKEWMT